MKTPLERFFDYISYNTQSSESSTMIPSSDGQRIFAARLAQDLRDLGIENVWLTDHGYVIAALPATPGYEKTDTVGFLAHIDTSPAAPGANIKPQIHRNWDGSPIRLGNTDLTVTPVESAVGKTIVTTDGTTLLGADDKAGVVAILCALEQIVSQNLPHGPLSVAFTTDEEVGGDIGSLDLKRFGAKYAYTIDGSNVAACAFRNFNAASAKLTFHGKSEHTGSAWHTMRNALRIAMEYQMSLPQDDVPEESCGMQGFIHCDSGGGDVGEAKLSYLIRSFDRDGLEKRKKTMRAAADEINRKYGSGVAEITITDSYQNMEEVMRQHPHVVDIAKNAIRALGIEPIEGNIRGGTDGARLSYMGLPCPNLGAGGRNFHGVCEYLIVEELEQSVQLIKNIVKLVAER